MQLSLSETNELAKAGIGMQTLTNDHSSTALQLAREFIGILSSNATDPARFEKQEVLGIIGQLTGRNNTESAVSFLEKFQWLPLDRAKGYAGYWLSMVIVSGIMVTLRLFSRLKCGSGLRRDDWLIIAAWILASENNIQDVVLVIWYNWEEHCWNQSLFEINMHFKIAAADQFIACVSPLFFKAALIIFYHDLCPMKWFRRITSILGVVVVIYTILSIIFFAVRCTPFDTWNHPYSHKCISSDLQLFYAITAINIPIDLAIVALPVFTVTSLHLPRAEKFSVIVLIGIGSLVCIASIVRITTLKDFTSSSDVARRSLRATTWQLLEVHLGIMCASVPALKKLFRVITGSSSISKSSRGGGGTMTVQSHMRKPGQHDGSIIGIVRIDSNCSGEITPSPQRRASGAGMSGKSEVIVGNEMAVLESWESSGNRGIRNENDRV